MQKKKTMQRMAAFGIPDHYLNVRSTFAQTLERYAEGEYDGTSRMVLVMEGPRTAPISGPDGDVAVDEIIMTAYRNKKEPIRSYGQPECDIAGQKNERECLGTVMEFRFRPIRHDETRVWASYREGLATVRALFREFVTEKIEKWYPAVGSLWRKHEEELERQGLEIIERYLEMESGDAGAAASAIAPVSVEGGPVTTAKQDAPPPWSGAAIPKRRRGRKTIDSKEINQICTAWLEVQDKQNQDTFCNMKGISSSTLRRWLKSYSYPES